MIKTFKTKQEVELDSRTGKTGIVFVDVGEVMFNGLAFYGKADYYHLENGVRTPIESTVATFTVAEADALAAQAALDGNTFSEQFTSLIIRATLYQFQTAQYYGIGAADWEIYVEPEPEEEEQPEEGGEE